MGGALRPPPSPLRRRSSSIHERRPRSGSRVVSSPPTVARGRSDSAMSARSGRRGSVEELLRPPAPALPPPKPTLVAEARRLGVRRSCRRVARSSLFEDFILLSVALNTCLLASESPLADEDDRAEYLVVFDYIFTTIFFLEMVLKMTAFSLWRKKDAYFRDAWNVLDFVIVVEGIASLAADGEDMGIDLSTLKTLRVLRPLRTITHIPTLRALVLALLGSIPLLMNVLVVCLFYFLLFGIIGQQLWQGKLRARCFDVETGLVEDGGQGSLCGAYSCGEGMFCGRWTDSPDNDISHFDNIFVSCLTIFQCITLEGWAHIMYATMDVSGDFTCIYFLLLIVFGSFIMINLTLAVIFSSFRDVVQGKRTEELAEQSLEALEGADDAAGSGGEGGGSEDGASAPPPPPPPPPPPEEEVEKEEHDQDPDQGQDEKAGDEEEEEELPTGMWPEEDYPQYPVCVLARRTTQHVAFKSTIYSCILLNTVVLMLDGDTMADDVRDDLQSISRVLTVVFVAEMVLKLVALSPQGYAYDRFNLLDGFVAVATLLEMLLLDAASLSAIRSVRVIRLFRVFQLTRLARYLKSMQLIISIVASSLGSIGSIFLLLLLFLMVFSLLGLQLFGGQFGDNPPRANYDSFFWATITTFQVLSGEGWNEIMYDTVSVTHKVYAVFFVAWIVVGNLVLLNLFLAVLLETSEDEGLKQEEEEELARQAERKRKEEQLRALITDSMVLGADGSAASIARPSIKPKSRQQLAREDSLKRTRTAARRHDIAVDELDDDVFALPFYKRNALLLFSPRSAVRRRAAYILSWQKFDTVILGLIVLSSCTLALEDPHSDEVTPLSEALELLEWFFTIVFSVEIVLKILCDGLVLYCEHSFLWDPWNWIDLVVVGASLSSLASDGDGLGWLRILRLLRALRPLRLITHNRELQIVVNTLFRSWAGLFNVTLVLLLVWVIFAIIGMQLFGGSLWRCTDEGFPEGAPFAGTDSVPPCTNVVNAPNNFDNILEAMLSLFVMSSGEGWPDIMFWAVDVTEADHQPKVDSQPAAALYFVLFICAGSFFLLNLFTGVMFENFVRTKKEFEDSEWSQQLEMERRLSLVSPIVVLEPPKGAFRVAMFRVTQHDYFQPAVMGAIVLNVLVMATVHYNQPDYWTATLEVLNIAFAALFTMELLVKVAAMGLSKYLHDRWNLLDLLVVVGSLTDVFATFAGLNIDSAFRLGRALMRLVRLIRFSRLMRLARSVEKLRTLFLGVWLSIPSIFNVGFLLLLLVYIYAVLGMFVFGDLELRTSLNRHANFGSFPMALLTLFRISTGEGWNEIMYDMQEESAFAPVYCASFVMLGQFMLINLFIMTIIDHYQEVVDGSVMMAPEDIEDFQLAWSVLRPHGGKNIPMARVPSLLRILRKPMGVGLTGSWARIELRMEDLALQPDERDAVSFNQVLRNIYRITWGIESRAIAERSQRLAIMRLRLCMREYVLRRRLRAQRQVDTELALRQAAAGGAPLGESERAWFKLTFADILHMLVLQERKLDERQRVAERERQALAEAHDLEMGDVRAEAERLRALVPPEALPLPLPASQHSEAVARLRGELHDLSVRGAAYGAELEDLQARLRAQLEESIEWLGDDSGSQPLPQPELIARPVTNNLEQTARFPDAHRERVTAMLLAADDLLFTGAADGCLVVWVKAIDGWRSAQELRKSHASAVRALAFDHDGWMLWSGGEDSAVKLWEAVEDRDRSVKWALHATLGGFFWSAHSGAVNALQALPHKALVASASADKTVKLWLTDMRAERTLKGHASPVHTLGLSDDGARLASGDRAGSVLVWDTETWAPVSSLAAALPGSAAPAVTATVVAGGYVYAGVQDGSIAVFDLDQLTLQTRLNGHADRVHAIALFGDWLISTAEDQFIMVWDIGTESVVRGMANASPVMCLAAGARTLFCGCADASLVLYAPAEEDHHLAAVPEALLAAGGSGSLGSLGSLGSYGSAEQQQSASPPGSPDVRGRARSRSRSPASPDMRERSRSPAAPASRRRSRSPASPPRRDRSPAAPTSRGRSRSPASPPRRDASPPRRDASPPAPVVVRSRRSRSPAAPPRPCSPEPEPEPHPQPQPQPPQPEPDSCTDSDPPTETDPVPYSDEPPTPARSEGRSVRSGSAGPPRLDMHSLSQLAEPDAVRARAASRARVDEVLHQHVAQDDSLVAERAVVLDVRSLELTQQLAAHRRAVNCVRYDPACKLLFTGADDREVRVWVLGAEGWTCCQTLAGHEGRVLALETSDGGVLLYSAGADRCVNVWQSEFLADGTFAYEHVVRWEGHAKPVFALAYYRPGEALLSGSGDHTLRVWDWNTGGAQVLEAHLGAVRALVATTEVVASASADGNVIVWDPRSWTPLRTIATPDSRGATSLATFEALLFAGAADGNVWVWNLHTYEALPPLAGHSNAVTDVCAFGGHLLSGSEDQFVLAWDLRTMTLERGFCGQAGAVRCVTAGADMIASAAADNTVRVWSVVSTEPSRSLLDSMSKLMGSGSGSESGGSVAADDVGEEEQEDDDGGSDGGGIMSTISRLFGGSSVDGGSRRGGTSDAGSRSGSVFDGLLSAFASTTDSEEEDEERLPPPQRARVTRARRSLVATQTTDI